jgi:DNA polymerase I
LKLENGRKITYLTHDERFWACDIEADNLLDKATTIWCVGLINLKTKEKIECRSRSEFEDFVGKHTSAIFVGHNFVAYDAVMLNRFWGAKIPIARIVDTFILSQLYNPNMVGGHSLEAWGRRLRYHKAAHSDFSCFTEEMMRYCMRDVMLTGLLFTKLSERMRQVGFTERGAEIEHKAWNIIQNRQKKAGFPFNIKGAQELYVSLRAQEESLKREIYKLWPPKLEVVATYKAARKKDGEYSAQYVRHRAQYPVIRELDDGRYEVSDWVAFNLGSPLQRIEKLIDLGWRPVNLTKKGNPRVDEDELLAFAESSGRPEVGYLAKWIVTNSRANMVNTWMEAYNDDTRAIHGNLFIASTLRYKHSSPNSANIPAVRLKKDDQGNDQIQYEEAGAYTYEVRNLWTAGDEGWSLVGVDGKGIQLRVLANYAYSDEFVARVLDGDPHSNNIKVLGLQNKAAAKKFLYTTLMGGGGAKLAVDQAQFGTVLTAREGNELKEKLIASIPGFGDLIEKLQRELEDTGRITLCDGSKIIVPSPHMVIPYLLQGDESRLMKQALIYLYEELVRHRLLEHVFKVADIHDEWQFRVRNEYVTTFTELCLPCFVRAGESFDYRVPIEGDFKVGKTWAATH